MDDARGSPLGRAAGPLAETGKVTRTMTRFYARFNVGYADVTIVETVKKKHIPNVQSEDVVRFKALKQPKERCCGKN